MGLYRYQLEGKKIVPAEMILDDHEVDAKMHRQIRSHYSFEEGEMHVANALYAISNGNKIPAKSKAWIAKQKALQSEANKIKAANAEARKGLFPINRPVLKTATATQVKTFATSMGFKIGASATKSQVIDMIMKAYE